MLQYCRYKFEEAQEWNDNYKIAFFAVLIDRLINEVLQDMGDYCYEYAIRISTHIQ